jgi:hypothetical protein
MIQPRIDWHCHFHGSLPTAELDALLLDRVSQEASQPYFSTLVARPGLSDFFNMYASIEAKAKVARQLVGDDFDAIAIGWMRAEFLNHSVQEAHLFFSASLSVEETVGRARRVIDAARSTVGTRLILRLTFPRRRRHPLTVIEHIVKSVARLDPHGDVLEGWDISDMDSAVTIPESICIAAKLSALRDEEEARGGPRRTLTCHVGEHFLTWTLDDLERYFSSLKALRVDRLGHASVLFVCDDALRRASVAPALQGTQAVRRALARNLADAGIRFEICPTVFRLTQPLCECCSSPWRRSGVARSGFLVGTDSPAALSVDVGSEERSLWT